MRYSSCVSRFITRRVVLSCWLAVCLLCGLSVLVPAVLWGRSALAAWCCVRRVVVRVSVSFRRGVWCCVVAVVLPWCCPVCWSTVCASSSARHALLPAVTVLLPSLSAVCQSYGLPSVIRSALACFGCAALALRI